MENEALPGIFMNWGANAHVHSAVQSCLPTTTPTEIEAMVELTRWTAGAWLGTLISQSAHKARTCTLSEALMSQDPDNSPSFMIPFNPMGRIRFFWFSTRYLVQDLQNGVGILPFDPYNRVFWELAWLTRRSDGQATDVAFSKVCAVQGVDPQFARKLVALAPWTADAHLERPLSLGATLILDTSEYSISMRNQALLTAVTELQNSVGRAFGHLAYTWTAVHQFLEDNCQDVNEEWLRLPASKRASLHA